MIIGFNYIKMQSPRVETAGEDSTVTPYSDRCMIGCGTLCIVVATLFFFGNISMIVWLFEHKYPVKYSVVCFMLASGVLYLTSFTSSLLLITRRLPRNCNKNSRLISTEAPIAGFAHRAGASQECSEMSNNISYIENPNLSQLPQKAMMRKTPPPPYDPSGNRPPASEHSTSENEIGDIESAGQTSATSRLTPPSVHYEFERNNAHIREQLNFMQRPTKHEFIPSDAPMQQTSPKIIVSSYDGSPSGSFTSEQLNISNLEYPFQDVTYSNVLGRNKNWLNTSTHSERSPRPVKRNPSTALKRKLKTRMSMSQSDLDSESRTDTSRSDSNSDMPTSHSNFNLCGFYRSDCSASVQTSQTNLNPDRTPKFSRRNAEGRTSQININPVARTQISESSLKVDMQKPLPNSNSEGRGPELSSNLNIETQQFASNSNWLKPADRRFTSHFNLHLNAESHSNTNSDASEHSSHIYSNSNSSVTSSRSHLVDFDTKKPEQFVARSKDAPMIHKAQSFGSLMGNAPPTHLRKEQMEMIALRTAGEGHHALANNHSSRVPGRSTESVLEASRNSKEMEPQEWIAAWNRGFHKLRSKDGERIVGVRI